MTTLEQVRHYQQMAAEASHGSILDAWRRIEYIEQQRVAEARNRGINVTADGNVNQDVWGDAR
jgi:hypothetical protein